MQKKRQTKTANISKVENGKLWWRMGNFGLLVLRNLDIWGGLIWSYMYIEAFTVEKFQMQDEP